MLCKCNTDHYYANVYKLSVPSITTCSTLPRLLMPAYRAGLAPYTLRCKRSQLMQRQPATLAALPAYNHMLVPAVSDAADAASHYAADAASVLGGSCAGINRS